MQHASGAGPLPFTAAAIVAGAVLAGRRSGPANRLLGAACGALVALTVWTMWSHRRGASRRSMAPGPMTQATVPSTPADCPIGAPGANLEQRLDEAIHETFPASDPIAVTIE
jgi:uncharacterized membrane protein YccC